MVLNEETFRITAARSYLCFATGANLGGNFSCGSCKKNCKNGKKLEPAKFRYTRYIHLPSWQYSMLPHSLKAALGPVHSFPPFFGFGFVQSLFLVCMPLLFLLHRLHMLQALHPPWTCKWREKSLSYCFKLNQGRYVFITNKNQTDNNN